tara:strand:+ start:1889 stop:2512 length:624 start_codon:yes stop_codon:yes gene_type:complete
MSFQSVIDNAEQIGILRRPIVAQTISRSNIVRSISRGSNVWRFEVKLPDGPRWTDYRSLISGIEALDKINTDTIRFNNTGHQWLIGYQGDLTNKTNIQVTVPSSGNSVTITSGASGLVSGQYRFRAGDFIQLGASGKCYTVAEDVAYNQSVVTLHRPLINETAGTGVTLKVAEDCVWTVQCIQFPNWSLFARDQVSWDGTFIFQEVI